MVQNRQVPVTQALARPEVDRREVDAATPSSGYPLDRESIGVGLRQRLGIRPAHANPTAGSHGHSS